METANLFYHKKEIAASLHISLATLYRKLKKYGFS